MLLPAPPGAEPGGMLNPRRDACLLDLGHATAGAVHLNDCRAAGMRDDRIRSLVESGRWQSPYPRVFVTFSGPVPLLTRQYPSVLYAGEGAALSQESAGAGYGLCREPELIQVTIPYRREVADQSGLRIHRSRTIAPSDCHPALSPLRTRIERTVLDLLASQRTADAALGLVADALRHGATTPDRLRAVLEQRPRTRWRRVITDALPDLSRGAQSPLEIRGARLRRVHGLPEGRRQVRRLRDGTEYLDIVIEEFGLHVELDGRLGHDRAREIWRDMRRDNASEVRGMAHLRYGWADLDDRSCEVAIEQAGVLRRRGWQGRFRPCTRCPPAAWSICEG
jgi:hypothetical protein